MPRAGNRIKEIEEEISVFKNADKQYYRRKRFKELNCSPNQLAGLVHSPPTPNEVQSSQLYSKFENASDD